MMLDNEESTNSAIIHLSCSQLCFSPSSRIHYIDQLVKFDCGMEKNYVMTMLT